MRRASAPLPPPPLRAAPEAEVRRPPDLHIARSVAIRDLRRASVPAPIVRDDAIAVIEEEEHLRVQSSADSGQPWLKTIGWPLLQSLHLNAILRLDNAHSTLPVLNFTLPLREARSFLENVSVWEGMYPLSV